MKRKQVRITIVWTLITTSTMKQQWTTRTIAEIFSRSTQNEINVWLSVHHLSSNPFYFTASWEKYADPDVQFGLSQKRLATVPPSCGRFENLHIEVCAAAYGSRQRPRRRSWHYLGKATAEGPSSSGEIELQISLSSRRDPWKRMVYGQLQFLGGHNTSIE